ncbi:alanine dehydrogenase [bacterium BMS3Abin10]|nr:alanine dehydrogenase [bacterium BMS3Abin10]GBE40073.1 alanine dehydrogenase [bacterium BMS3Bbin08]
MIIGVPKEIKEHEYRVGLTPFGAGELKKQGHRVIVEGSAGEGSGFSDKEYQEAGSEISDKTSLFRDSELIVKVKEPLPSEYDLFREGHALFTFLHLAANPGLTDFLLRKKITGFAYGTLEENQTLPLLAPMSEIAGRMAPIMAAYYLQADVLIVAVLIPGARAPRLVSREMVSRMKKGSVIVDVSVDQGGCVETTRPTSHTDPVYTVDGVIHYCVANMPGAYPRTSTFALINRTLPYIKKLAKNGIAWAAEQDRTFQTALNTYKGKITNKALAGSFSEGR